MIVQDDKSWDDFVDIIADTVFVIQSQNDAQNFKIICEKARRKTLRTKLTFCHLDHYTLQATILPSSWYNKFDVCCINPCRQVAGNPIYLCSIVSQMRLALMFRREVESYQWCVGSIVAGNDGILQRALFASQKKQTSIFLIYDGLLTPESRVELVRRKLRSFMVSVVSPFASPFRWSFIFSKGLCQHPVACVYTMHHSVKSEFKSRRIRSPVRVTVMPRLKRTLSRLSLAAPIRNEARNLNILIATSAWAWHGRSDYAEAHIADISEVYDYVSDRIQSARFKLRVHPRDNKGNYSHLQPPLSSAQDYWEDLLWADVLICTRSTLAYEALLIDKHVINLALRIPKSSRSYWDLESSIVTVESIDALLSTLTDLNRRKLTTYA